MIEQEEVSAAVVDEAQGQKLPEVSGQRSNRFEGNRFDRGGKRNFSNRNGENNDEYESLILSLRRVSKTRAGGRKPAFSILLAVGGNGMIGVGTAKSGDVHDAVKKAEKKARKKMLKIALLDGRTPSYNITRSFCGVKIILLQAKAGRGLVAGGIARKMLKVAGVKDVVCKIVGNSTADHNVAYCLMACIKGLSSLYSISDRLGKSVQEILSRKIR